MISNENFICSAVCQFFRVFFRGQLWCSGTSVWLYTGQVVDSNPTQGNKLFKVFFPCSGIEAKRDFEFRHLNKRQCLQNLAENEERSVLSLGFT